MPEPTSQQKVRLLNRKISSLRAVVYITLSILVLATCLVVFNAFLPTFEPPFETFFSTPPKTPVAYLYLSPEKGSYKVGDEFTVDVLINTAGSNVVAANAYLTYDKTKMQALSIDITGSVFDIQAISKIIPEYGKVEIVLGKPTPGIRTQSGNQVRMATVHFRALDKTNPKTENITFDFTKGVVDYSAVFLGKPKSTEATDILDATRGAKIFIN